MMQYLGKGSEILQPVWQYEADGRVDVKIIIFQLWQLCLI